MKPLVAVLFSYAVSAFFVVLSIVVGFYVYPALVEVSGQSKVNITYAAFFVFSVSVLMLLFLQHVYLKKPHRILRDGSLFFVPSAATWYFYWSIPRSVTLCVLISALAIIWYQFIALVEKSGPA